jgi:hypothetical protein
MKKRKPITVTISKNGVTSMFRKGDVISLKLLSRHRYGIITGDSKDNYGAENEDFEDVMTSTVSVKALSKWEIIRKIQIAYFRLIIMKK